MVYLLLRFVDLIIQNFIERETRKHEYKRKHRKGETCGREKSKRTYEESYSFGERNTLLGSVLDPCKTLMGVSI